MNDPYVDLMDRCLECHAPIGFTESGVMRFDSSQYHIDAAKKLSEISMWKGYAKSLEVALQEIIDAGHIQRTAKIAKIAREAID